MKRYLFVLVLLGLSLVLSGCWDIKSLQDVNYFTGIGIDFRDNKYHVYVQQLDFSNVAKSEGNSKSSTSTNIWVGHAEGVSISEAVVELYQTTQQTVFWGHLSSMVFTENLLKKGDLLAVFDALMRNPEIRYTPWVYGTKKDLQKIYTTTPFFSLSPLNSILYSPETNYKQRPIVVPLRFSQFVRGFRDPGNTVLLPSISISDDTWAENKKADPKLEVDGVFAMYNNELKGWTSHEKLLGLRWLERKSQASRVVLRENGVNIASLKFTAPHPKIQISFNNGQPIFNIKVKVVAALNELLVPKTEQQLEKMACEKISEEIRETFQFGIQKQTDLLALEHTLYRKKYNRWNDMTASGSIPPSQLQIGDVNVKVAIVQSGMFNLSRKMKLNTSSSSK
ncbi:Ger(x)C family spore germination protein [Cohnella abietis]|uniref:Spore germination protein B3 n=1 Tax=Cohnella abietis TaxID=2507935 RepID=A0A3T1D6L0_9BACL|nr:Ger(x)C family spore germination protein [Cohnella abietis]BBI33712.1 spore germination protein B3 [Cohnella abietis]